MIRSIWRALWRLVARPAENPRAHFAERVRDNAAPYVVSGALALGGVGQAGQAGAVLAEPGMIERGDASVSTAGTVHDYGAMRPYSNAGAALVGSGPSGALLDLAPVNARSSATLDLTTGGTI